MGHCSGSFGERKMCKNCKFLFLLSTKCTLTTAVFKIGLQQQKLLHWISGYIEHFHNLDL